MFGEKTPLTYVNYTCLTRLYRLILLLEFCWTMLLPWGSFCDPALRAFLIPYFFDYKTEFFPSKTIPKI